MKLGISTASFFSKELTEDTFKVIDSLGIGLCEVFLTTFSEYKKEFVQELQRRKGDIEIYSLHSLNVQFEPELFNTAKRTREDSEFFFLQIAEAAKILQAKYYTFHGLAIMKRTPYTVDFQRIGSRINELDKLLMESSSGCRLAYENVHWTIFNSPEYFKELQKYTSVHTCLDIKQAMQSKHSVYDYIDTMKGTAIANVHVCDYDDSGNLFVPGKGNVDFVTLFKYLSDAGYDGPIIMELYAGNYKTYDEIRSGYEYLANCLEKVK